MKLSPARALLAGDLLLVGALAFAAGGDARGQDPDEGASLFERAVRPILEANCFKCHGGRERIRGGLRLTSREGLLAGGDSGPVLDLADPSASRLLAMISYRDEDHEMPPTGKLPDASIATFERWFALGAPWPAGSEAPAPIDSEEPRRRGRDDGMASWSYAPLARPPVPAVRSADWVRNPIDAFLLARLEARGLAPAPPADRVALLRRAHYDLTGLPPTPAEVDAFVADERLDAFVADERLDAFERAVEALLERPQYGEKWGRHWLDVVRYAETNGYERDSDKPFIWRYRDYVIESFNQDKPYDRFVLEQLAGDELEQVTPETIVATGYQRLMQWDDEPGQGVLQARYDTLDDLISTTAQTFLGMTLGCARCHEHKGDPIPQADYYRFLAFFHGVTDVKREGNFTDILSPVEREQRDRQVAERQAEIERLTAERGRIEQAFLAGEGLEGQSLEDEGARESSADANDLPARIAEAGAEILGKAQLARYRELAEELERAERRKVLRRVAFAVQEHPEVADLHVHLRGNAHAPGEAVQPAFPSCLDPPQAVIPPRAEGAASSGRRRVLAEWIASPDNPLTARVMVNRIWQHHFGRGIVPSPNDFGEFGERPTHPALLDWLASEFIARGWSIKAMHRLIMASSSYRMSSRGDPEALRIDPGNNLLWRFDMRRLTAEELRDSLLSVSGRLNPKMGGPSFFSKIPAEALATSSRPNEVWGRSPQEETRRRSVYIKVKRSLTTPMLAAFDAADTDATCPVRFTTTGPAQALGLLNSEFVSEHAAALAARLLAEESESAERVRLALRLATARNPRAERVRADLSLLDELRGEYGLDERGALEKYCLLTLNLNEFLYLD